ncbi:MAG: HIRAN domain-containing protein [Acidimicrobiales bacterium]
MAERRRRAGDGVRLPVYLEGDHCTVEGADGLLVGLGFNAYLDQDRRRELGEDDEALVLPGVFHTRVTGTAFHDDVLSLDAFSAGRSVQIQPEHSNQQDRNALAVIGSGKKVGYLPRPVAEALAPAGTRSGQALVIKEWSVNGVRQGISVLGSMQVRLDFTTSR